MPKVVIFYKTKKAHSGHHHNPYGAGGLASNALHSVGVLRKLGIDVSMQRVDGVGDLKAYLIGNPDVTHAIIEAVWVRASELEDLATVFPGTQFVVRSHSKIGFLQVEPEAITIMRDIIALSRRFRNVMFSSNNEEFCGALSEAYGGRVLYLPNLYDLDASPPRRRIDDDVLRIGSFGATRLLKLHPASALAALQIARRLDSQLEFYVNVDSTPGGNSVRQTMRNMYSGLRDARLVELPWQDSDVFKETVASMDLLLQLSATETFCMVAADAVASGVPAVVGPAISWLPKQYQADIDNTSQVADVGVRALVGERRAVARERKALQEFVSDSTETWKNYLIPRRRCGWFW